MSRRNSLNLLLSGAVVAAGVAGGLSLQAQAPAQAPAAEQSWTNFTPTNELPNPYNTIEGFAKLGRAWGSTSAVDIDKDGRTIWVAERCGTNSCGNTPDIDTVYHF